MATRPAPMCYGCKHFQPPAGKWPTCAAFPQGIPRPILWSQVDHREPIPGDNGVRFEPVSAEDAEFAAHLFGANARPA